MGMEELIGEYTARNPYYPKRGRLPFVVHGVRAHGEYPLEVSTVEYKGPKRIAVHTQYSETVVRSLICKGIIRRREPKGENRMERQTVNVIEYANGAVLSVRSFSDDQEGNNEAEALFGACAKLNGMAESDRLVCVEDGVFEDGTYQIFLAHSL